MSLSSEHMQRLLALEMSAEVRAEVLTILFETVASLSVTNPSLVTPGALRQRRFRERHQTSQSVTEASPSVTCNKVLYDVKEIKEDHSTSKKPVTLSKRGSRVPPGFKPDDASWLWAKDKFGASQSQLEDLTDEFQDFWDANPGARGVKLDWNKTWRNRCRQKFAAAIDKAKTNGSGYSPSTPTSTESREEYIQRIQSRRA